MASCHNRDGEYLLQMSLSFRNAKESKEPPLTFSVRTLEDEEVVVGEVVAEVAVVDDGLGEEEEEVMTE